LKLAELHFFGKVLIIMKEKRKSFHSITLEKIPFCNNFIKKGIPKLF
jgi:hypothetical protein